ncbi:hypothetical protein [Haloarcula argentinensis]|uniref:Uncharacterized protein n=3 Tax=Haloarcula TaxID=2237 RepID=A0A847UHG0_HALAR|nr:hypothetical protein [Haloarcula argentinensis]NLV11687.1 hypothetical protein [Haloarcula argentinensis]
MTGIDKTEDDSDNVGSQLSSAYGEYSRVARQSRELDALETAGSFYVAAARIGMAKSIRLPDENRPPDASNANDLFFAQAVREFFLGSLCFRLAECDDRCQRHCEQGVAIMADARDALYNDPAEIGLSHEIIGDFRLVADFDNYQESYSLAADQYATIDNDLGWQMEDGFDDFSLIAIELADSAGLAPKDDDRQRIRRTSLDARIKFKQEQYPEIIDAIIDSGNWQSDII